MKNDPVQPKRQAKGLVQTTAEVNPAAEWREHWTAFLKKYPAWRPAAYREDAVYALPPKIIKVLAATRGPHRHLRPILSEAEAAAEYDFEHLCRNFHKYTVGVFESSPIQFPLLFPAWTAEGQSLVSSALGDVTPPSQIEIPGMNAQRLAYAARLCFHRPFCRELVKLREQWDLLPRPKPVCGPFWWPEPFRSGATEAVASYYSAYNEFRGHWHLGMLVSWDLPFPMGPGGPMRVDEAMKMLGPSFLVHYIPPYLRTRDESIADKIEVINAMAKHPVVFPNLPELPNMHRLIMKGPALHTYEVAFRIWLIELAAWRYHNRAGVRAALVRGCAKWLGISPERIKRLYRICAPFLPRGVSS